MYSSIAVYQPPSLPLGGVQIELPTYANNERPFATSPLIERRDSKTIHCAHDSNSFLSYLPKPPHSLHSIYNRTEFTSPSISFRAAYEEMPPKDLIFITGNKNKLAEVQSYLSTTGIKLESQSVDPPELQGTIEEISVDKAKRAADVG